MRLTRLFKMHGNAADPGSVHRRTNAPKHQGTPRWGVRALVVVLAALVITLDAQGPPVEQPSFRSAPSELVVLPVTVIDTQGRFVASLPQSAFSVRDNGVPQPLRFFTNEDTPVSVGLVIDTSTSMRSKLGEVVAAATAFARLSNPQDELFALSFNDDVREVLRNRWLLLASDVGDLERAVSSLVPEGRTSLYDAIMAGLNRLDEGSRARKVLIVVSDGGDNASQATLEDVLARARRSDAAIYTIGLASPDDPDSNPKVLASLARTTGGERFLPQSAGPLLQACERIAHEIRSGYTIAYEPPAHDGRYRRVQVAIEPPGRQRLIVRTRPGYVAAIGTSRPIN